MSARHQHAKDRALIAAIRRHWRSRRSRAIEYMLVGGPEPESWTGLAGMAASWPDWLSVWDRVYFEAGEYRELDEEPVIFPRRPRADAPGAPASHER